MRPGNERQKMTQVSTIRNIQEIANGGILTNDRGNGCGGPGYINEWEAGRSKILALPVSVVCLKDDPEAWHLAEDAASLQGIDPATLCGVAVGERVGDSGHQMIYAW